MALNYVGMPIEYWSDPKNFRPIYNGFIYVGIADLDPEIEANQKPVTARQEDGTEVPIAQPIRTNAGGKAVDSKGNIVELLVNGSYSLKVLNNLGDQKYYFSDVTDGVPVTFDDFPILGSGEWVVSDLVANEEISEGFMYRTSGYYNSGDGGAALYKVVSGGTGTPDGGSYINTNNGNQLELIPEEMISILVFGAIASTDCTTQITNARAYAESINKSVLIPAGEFLCDPIQISGTEIIVGENKNLSIIKTNPASNSHALEFLQGAEYCKIENLTLNQNSSSQTAGHIIRLGGTDFIDLKNLILLNGFSYGIGIQTGTNTNIDISKIYIEGTGQDGIDIKDFNLDNENIRLTDITVKSYGLNQSAQSGVDIRGPITVNNLRTIADSSNDAKCFRLRGETVQGRAGSGVISNLMHTGNGGAGSYCLQISGGVTDYVVTNCQSENTNLFAVFEADSGGVVQGVSAKTISGDAFSIFGSNVNISNIFIDGCDRGFDFEAGGVNNRISNFCIKNISGDNWARVQTGATGAIFTNGNIPEAKTLNNFEASTKVVDVENYKTMGSYESSDITIDSTGIKNFSITHDLAETPSTTGIQLSIIRSTGGPNDWESGYLQIETTTSTTITGSLSVVTASATPSASVKINARASILNA